MSAIEWVLLVVGLACAILIIRRVRKWSNERRLNFEILYYLNHDTFSMMLCDGSKDFLCSKCLWVLRAGLCNLGNEDMWIFILDEDGNVIRTKTIRCRNHAYVGIRWDKYYTYSLEKEIFEKVKNIITSLKEANCAVHARSNSS